MTFQLVLPRLQSTPPVKIRTTLSLRRLFLRAAAISLLLAAGVKAEFVKNDTHNGLNVVVNGTRQ